MDIIVIYKAKEDGKVGVKVKIELTDEEIKATLQELKRLIPSNEWAEFFSPDNGFQHGMRYLMSLVNAAGSSEYTYL